MDPETGIGYSHGIPIPELVLGTRHAEDVSVHGPMYAFLSEYAHVHMIVLGSYVTKGYERFVCEPSSSNPYSANLFVSYVSWLLVSELVTSGEVLPVDAEELECLVMLGEALESALDGLDADDPLLGLPEAMCCRLRAAGEILPFPAPSSRIERTPLAVVPVGNQ